MTEKEQQNCKPYSPDKITYSPGKATIEFTEFKTASPDICEKCGGSGIIKKLWVNICEQCRVVRY